ncbi:MAG: GTP 3',8-cyclase MoaA [Deltaproteobacteria bacterium]|nr:GTP 3',8-cyclase MoaA [Deltaproteobacteria bacterium]
MGISSRRPHVFTRFVSCLTDNYGRQINYLRLAVTDRCNLRCRYCMPDEGIPFIPHDQILRFEEMERLVRIFASMGVRKVRLTGGEPFVRKGVVPFIERLGKVPGIEEIHVTTNGVAASDHLAKLKAVGLSGINLSLDTLDRKRYHRICRRDLFASVLETLEEALKVGLSLKINTVMLDASGEEDLLALAELARTRPVSIRFIERMPFSGQGRGCPPVWSAGRMVRLLQQKYSGLSLRLTPRSSTSLLYRLPGFLGTVGVIGSYSRSFCAHCNKVRITPRGILKNCLYDDGTLDVRALLRTGVDDRELVRTLRAAIERKPEHGHAVEGSLEECTASMATIGG